MQRRGFTLIEFIIAVSIAAILGGVALSRYNSYQRDQDFLAGSQQIANCIQRASQLARAGTTVYGSQTVPARYVRTTVSYDATGKTISCLMEPFDGGRTTTTLLLGIPAEVSTGVQLFTAQSAKLVTGTNIRFVFGVLEAGQPLGMSVDGVATQQPDTAGSTYVPLGHGFTLDSSTNTLEIVNDTASLCGYVVMPSLGAPVRFEQKTNGTCP